MKKLMMVVLLLFVVTYSQLAAIKTVKNENNKERSVVATGYCLKGKMANGQRTRVGVVAADTRIYPLGTRLLINGKQYIVSDTGGSIRGNRIDVWMSNCSEAKKFGRKTLKIQVI